MSDKQKQFLRTPFAAAVTASVVTGFFVHFYALSNAMFNHDSMKIFLKGYSAGITSGRWFLEILDVITTWLGFSYNLPAVNGGIFLLLIAVSTGVVVDIFDVKSTRIAALVGMLFAVFPSTATAMFFRYTTIPYGLAILLAAGAVWILPRCRFGLILSAFCLALSMGIYQAFAPLTITLFVLQLLIQTIRGDIASGAELLRKGLRCCLALILGVVLYGGILKLLLMLFHIQLSDYQGISSMGAGAAGNLVSMVVEAYRSFFAMYIQDYCGLLPIPVLRIGYGILSVLGFAMAVLGLVKKVPSIGLRIMGLALCGLFPLAINFIVIMCPDSSIYTLMVSSFVLLPCLPLLLWEQLSPDLAGRAKCAVRRVLAVTILVVIFSHGYYANVNYSTLHYSTLQMESYLSSMVAQVRMTEGYTADKRWVMLGYSFDPTMKSVWEEGMVYGGNSIPMYMMHASVPNWLRNYMGYDFPMATKAEVESLKELPAVQQMPIWPNAGSIQVYGDFVIIRFSESFDLE